MCIGSYYKCHKDEQSSVEFRLCCRCSRVKALQYIRSAIAITYQALVSQYVGPYYMQRTQKLRGLKTDYTA